MAGSCGAWGRGHGYGHVVDIETVYGHFRKAAYKAGCRSGVLDNQIGKIHVSEYRGCRGNRLFFLGRAVFFVTGKGGAGIETVDDQGTEDTFHDDVVDPYVFHHASPQPSGFDAETAVGVLEYAVVDGHISYASRHLASDDYAAVAVCHGAVGDGYILAGPLLHIGIKFSAGFNCNTIVSYADVAVADMYVAAAFRVNAVCVGGIHRVLYCYIMNGDDVAVNRVYGPHGRVYDPDIFDQYAAAADEFHTAGPVVEFLVPPVPALPLIRPLPRMAIFSA